MAFVAVSLLSALIALVPIVGFAELAADRLELGREIGRLMVLTGLAMLAVIILVSRRWASASVVAGLTAVPLLSVWPVAVSLRGQPLWLAGLHGDQLFRTALMEKMRGGEFSADMYYEGLPGYYPQLWFWVGGRLAGDRPAWEYYAHYSLLTLALTASVVYVWWVVLLRSPVKALAPATVTALVGAVFGADEPYAWVITAMTAPFAVWVWRTLSGTGPHWALSGLGIGAFIGFSANVYTLNTGVAGLVVAVITLYLLVTRQASWRRTTATAAVAVGVAAAMMAPIWLPYFLAPTPPGGASSFATDYLPEVGAVLPDLLTGHGALGMMALVGAVTVVALWTVEEQVRPAGVIAAVALAWFPLSGLTYVVADTTLLAFRVIPVLILALAIASLTGIRRLLRHAPGASPAPIAVAAVAVIVAAGQTITPARMELLELTRAGQPVERALQLVEQITAAADKPASEITVLGAQPAVASVSGMTLWQAPVAAYANPKADVAGRGALIAEAAAAGDAAEFRAAIDALPYPLDAIIVPPERWVTVANEDRGHHFVHLPPEIFDDSWVSGEVDGFTWYVIIR